MLQSIAGMFLDIYKWILQGLTDIAGWALDGFTASLLSSVPQLVGLESLSGWLLFINGFIPIGYGATLLMAWFTIYSLVVAVRIFIKLIPGIG
jgi:hypothetical protein